MNNTISMHQKRPSDQEESVSSTPHSTKNKVTHCTPKLAQQLYNKGLEPIPIAPRQKFPTVKKWQSISLPIEPWPNNYGIGLRTGKSVIGIDLDIYDQSMVDDILKYCFSEDFQVPFDDEYLVRVGQPPKALIPVVCPEITSKMISEKYIDENGVINQIEILSQGQQFVAYGIHPDTKKRYEWNGDILTHSLPVVKIRFIEEIILYFQTQAIEAGWLSVSKQEKAKKISTSTPRQISGDEPGSVYNRTVSVVTLLKYYGWTYFQGPYWTRPGKSKGVSGAVYGDIFWCFTTSTVLRGGSRKEDRCFYDAFELLTQYEFGGDKSECARALRKEMRKVA